MVKSLFRRKQADAPVTEPEPEPTTKVGGKGRPTPKRRDARARRRQVGPAPTTRKEATKRMRERQRVERAEAREGMMRGEEKYLMPRDKGPARRLVRDIVDARWNVGQVFLIGTLLIFFAVQPGFPPVIRTYANVIWIALLLALLADSTFIGFRINRLVKARLPESKERMFSLYLYGAMRATIFRRMRAPRPQVKVGERISPKPE